MDWIYFIFMFLNGVFCYWMGTRVAEAEHDKEFQPTQETWLELQKFRWTHKYNAEEKTDADSRNP